MINLFTLKNSGFNIIYNLVFYINLVNFKLIINKNNNLSN